MIVMNTFISFCLLFLSVPLSLLLSISILGSSYYIKLANLYIHLANVLKQNSNDNPNEDKRNLHPFYVSL